MLREDYCVNIPFMNHKLKYKSRNFSLEEVLHRKDSLSEDVIDVGLYRMGYLQALRDVLGSPITVTSGNRDLKYNRSIGSSDSSYHRYRIENNRLIGANDLRSTVPNDKLYEVISRNSHGETYLHRRLGFVHNSDYNKEEKDEQWIQ